MHLLLDLLSRFGDAAAFALVFLAAAYVPIPSSLVMVAAGGLVATGRLPLVWTFGALVVASVLGDVTGYGMARWITGRRTWRRRAARHASLLRLENLLKRRPLTTIVWSRFVPFGASSVNSLAGMSRLRLARFLAPDVLGDLLYAGAYLSLGELFGRAWGDAGLASTVAAVIALLIGAGVVAGFLLTRRDQPVRAAPAKTGKGG